MYIIINANIAKETLAYLINESNPLLKLKVLVITSSLKSIEVISLKDSKSTLKLSTFAPFLINTKYESSKGLSSPFKSTFNSLEILSSAVCLDTYCISDVPSIFLT